MKKLVCAALVLALLLTSFASADMKILTKVGIQQKLGKAFNEKAESVELICAAPLFSELVEDRFSVLSLLAWKAGIITYQFSSSVRDHSITMTDIEYADTPLPYKTVYSEEEFISALKEFAETKTPSFGLYCPYSAQGIYLIDGFREIGVFENNAPMFGIVSGRFVYLWNHFFCARDIGYLDCPVTGAEDIEEFYEAVSAFRDEGITEFLVIFDPETYETCFSEFAAEEDIANILRSAGILTLNNIGFVDSFCYVYFDVGAWVNESAE